MIKLFSTYKFIVFIISSVCFFYQYAKCQDLSAEFDKFIKMHNAIIEDQKTIGKIRGIQMVRSSDIKRDLGSSFNPICSEKIDANLKNLDISFKYCSSKLTEIEENEILALLMKPDPILFNVSNLINFSEKDMILFKEFYETNVLKVVGINSPEFTENLIMSKILKTMEIDGSFISYSVTYRERTSEFDKKEVVIDDALVKKMSFNILLNQKNKLCLIYKTPICNSSEINMLILEPFIKAFYEKKSLIVKLLQMNNEVKNPNPKTPQK